MLIKLTGFGDENSDVYINPDNICAIYEDTYCGDHRSVIVLDLKQ